MDPLGFVDGTSLYRAYFVPTKVDPSGQLSVRDLGPKFDECGGLKHQINWKFESGEVNGYVIQRVCFYGQREQCPSESEVPCKGVFDVNPEGRTCSTSCYVELWEVRNRKPIGARNLNDLFSFPSCDHTRGAYSQYGEAIFVPDNEGDWLGSYKPKDILDRFKTGKDGVSAAGTLRSACMDDPGIREFWKSAFSKYGRDGVWRYSLVDWDCCCGKEVWIRKKSTVVRQPAWRH